MAYTLTDQDHADIATIEAQLADLLQSAPTSERGWSGQPLQPYAAQLVRAYLDGIQTAAEVIQQHAL